MTQREIRPTREGFVVVELQPKVIARFVDEQHAQIFCDVLDASALEAPARTHRDPQEFDAMLIAADEAGLAAIAAEIGLPLDAVRAKQGELRAQAEGPV